MSEESMNLRESDYRCARRAGLTSEFSRYIADKLQRERTSQPTPYQAFLLGKYVGEIVGRLKKQRELEGKSAVAKGKKL